MAWLSGGWALVVSSDVLLQKEEAPARGVPGPPCYVGAQTKTDVPAVLSGRYSSLQLDCIPRLE